MENFQKKFAEIQEINGPLLVEVGRITALVQYPPPPKKKSKRSQKWMK